MPRLPAKCVQMTLLPFFLYSSVKFGLHTTTFHFLVVTTVDPSHSGEEVHQGVKKVTNDITKEKPHPNQVPSDPSVNSDPRPTYTWTKSGHTECSTTCGTGEEI